MILLSPSDAVLLVRKNLDEVGPNDSIMYGPDNDEFKDNNSMDDIIKKNLPEAINHVHLAAPVQLLEGKDFDSADLDSVRLSADGVLSVALKNTTNYLRLVAFKAADSSIVVTDVLAEASPEGRKQLNPYVRGRFDRPRLVLRQGRHTGPALDYYTLNLNGDGFDGYVADPSTAISELTFVQEQFYSSDAAGYPISRRLRQNIIDQLTAMVMDTYLDQRSQAFYQKAINFSTI